jgi:hypothetical protein
MFRQSEPLGVGRHASISLTSELRSTYAFKSHGILCRNCALHKPYIGARISSDLGAGCGKHSLPRYQANSLSPSKSQDIECFAVDQKAGPNTVDMILVTPIEP